MNKEKSLIEKLRPYQRLYEAIVTRLEAELQKEFEKKGGDTNTYLPEEWKKIED